jgi:putative oxidoreductase
MDKWLTRPIPAYFLVLRLWVGLNMALSHGFGKISDPGAFLASGGMAHFESLPLPQAWGWFAIFAEFLGGLLLAAGLFTRLAALSIFGTMLGAAFVVHFDDPWSRKEMALAYAIMALVFVFKGGGKASLDALVFRRSS